MAQDDRWATATTLAAILRREPPPAVLRRPNGDPAWGYHGRPPMRRRRGSKGLSAARRALRHSRWRV
ncbi:hypothetical protein MTO96_007313 [Rhipicephalus appendiculatus]